MLCFLCRVKPLIRQPALLCCLVLEFWKHLLAAPGGDRVSEETKHDPAVLPFTMWKAGLTDCVSCTIEQQFISDGTCLSQVLSFEQSLCSW